MRLLPYLIIPVALFIAGCKNLPSQSTIPIPKSVELTDQIMQLSEGKIVYTNPSLKRLAEVLQNDIFMAYNLNLEITDEADGNSNIILKKNSALKDENYTINVSDNAVLEAGDYNTLAMATVTLLQSIQELDGKVGLAGMSLNDKPDSWYRGLLMDLARQPHTVDTMKQIITICRMYKVNYLQLHLNDDQSTAFESKAFPKLATPKFAFSVEELKELNSFAAVRGVTIIPELDAPAHTGAMRKAMPELFGRNGLSVVNMAKPEVYDAFETMIGELCEIFTNTPYFHIGADECYLVPMSKMPETKDFLKKHDLDSVHDLYYHFVTKMDEIVRKNGKKTIMWESFTGDGSAKVKIPKDILVMAWETMYQHPQSLIDNGYTIINAAWKPMYYTPGRMWSQEHIFNWDIYTWENHWINAPSYDPIHIAPTNKVVGGQMCAWERSDWMEVPDIRVRIPVACERWWNIEEVGTYDEFYQRWKRDDEILQNIIRPILVEAEGLSNPGYIGDILNKQNWFTNSVTVSMSPLKPGTIRYTLDGSEPTAKSPIYKDPFTLNETKELKAKLYDDKGQQLGFILTKKFEIRPFMLEVEGLLAGVYHPDPEKPYSKFADEVLITMTPSVTNCQIRYSRGRINWGNPNYLDIKYFPDVYKEPLVINNNERINVQAFKDGKAFGGLEIQDLAKVEFVESLTYGKPVKASMGHDGPFGVKNMVDGIAHNDLYWHANWIESAPWVEVDLEKVEKISKANVTFYTDNNRYYQYFIEVSKDGKNWTKVVDRSKNTEKAVTAGITDTFEPIEARYIKLTVTKNSSNRGTHATDLRIFN